MTSADTELLSTRSISDFGGRLLPQKSYGSISNFGSAGSGWHGGASFSGGSGWRLRPSHGYSLGLGFGGGLQSQASIGLGLSAGGGRFSSGLAMGGSRLGLGLGLGMASGYGGGRVVSGWAAGGGGGGGSGGSGAGFWAGVDKVVAFNEKLELQTLNDRLATYLDKVKRLETANHELEEKLRGFQANKVQVTYDLTLHQQQLQPLRAQLLEVMRDCSRIALNIDNAKLAADDFRMKYENILAMRQAVESDTAALKALRREYDVTIATLQQEYSILLKERTAMDDVHLKEVKELRSHMAGTLTVKVEAADSVNLSHRLVDLRSEYETLLQKNHREIESWYSNKVAAKDTEIHVLTDSTVTESAEINVSRTLILQLETELDSLLLQKAHQEQKLVDIQGHRQMELLTLSRLAGSLEGELASVRESALLQAQEYQLLLSTKVQLEREISTYRTLLEGVGDKFNIVPSSWLRSSSSISVEGKAGVLSDAGSSAALEASADAKPSSETEGE